MKREPQFKTEADLCAAFIEWLEQRHQDWTAYAETEGWDILLVHVDGTQIGIQAKLKFNMAVLTQAAEDGNGWHDIGPDYRAVLVPEDQGIRTICDVLGITLIRPRQDWPRWGFDPDLTDSAYERWHYANPKKRHQLPEYVPDVPAGASAPVALTRWKIGALKVSAIIELRGYVTRADFRSCSIDHRRWIDAWLEPVPEKPGAWRWKNGVNQGFASQHPVIYPKVLEELRVAGMTKEVGALV